jgi:hypothetical protein
MDFCEDRALEKTNLQVVELKFRAILVPYGFFATVVENEMDRSVKNGTINRENPSE